MTLVPGMIVQNQQAPSAPNGRVCKVGLITSCVQFPVGCLRVANSDLVPASGSAPACTAACTDGTAPID